VVLHGSCRSGYWFMVMPSDERPMPGEGSRGQLRQWQQSTGDSSGGWVFGSVLAASSVG